MRERHSRRRGGERRRLIFLLMLGLFSFPAGGAGGNEAEKKGEAMGRLHVYTQPEGAVVYIDGEKVEETSPVKAGVAPGRHELRVEREGYRPETRTVEATAGEATTVMLILAPLPEQAATDRREANQGGYFLAGPLSFRIITSDISLGSSVNEAEQKLQQVERTAPGLTLTLRYVQPLGKRRFLIVDTNYLDARLSAENVSFPAPQGKVDKIELLLFRGGVEFSVAPNAVDFFVPYIGAGVNYTILRDARHTGWLGSDNQEEFIGYTLKAGFFWNSRYHLVFGAEYQYHWSYPMEDYMILGMIGYQF